MEVLGRLGLVLLILFVLTFFLGIFYYIYISFRNEIGVTFYDTEAFIYGMGLVVFAFALLIGSIIYIKNR